MNSHILSRVLITIFFNVLLCFQVAYAEFVTNQLVVRGDGKVNIIAKTAFIQISNEISAKSADLVRQSLAIKSKKVLSALRMAKADNIETQAMRIYPEYSRDTTRSLLGYKGVTSIQFESHVDKAGKLIDIAVKAGANRVDNVSIKAKDSKVEVAKQEALKRASKNALIKGKAVLAALNLKMTGITNIKVNMKQHAISYPLRAMSALKMQDVSTEILEKKQSVRAFVILTLSYNAL